MSLKKVQIFYASIGSGHLSAARSIAQAISQMDNEILIELRDIFRPSMINTAIQEFSSFLQTSIFPGIYTYVWKRGTFRWLYEIFAQTGPIRREILKNINAFKPDVIICTHTYPCTVISHWKKKHLKMPLIAVATDQYVHPYWSRVNVDHFIVPNEAMREELLQRGYENKNLHNFGIPVSIPHKDDSSSKIIEGKYLATILAGTYQIAPYRVIHPLVRQMFVYLQGSKPSNIIWQFVFGAANELKTEAKNDFSSRNDVQIYDFPENMQAMIAGSDFIFTKPGGLTVAEALASKKPIILLNRGAGQERENTNFVIGSGAGLLASSRSELVAILNRMSTDPKLFKQGFKFLSEPQRKSAVMVAELVKKILNDKCNQ
jgi:processive 1,2-diacylglycerol beta-glucosyltransferase